MCPLSCPKLSCPVLSPSAGWHLPYAFVQILPFSIWAQTQSPEQNIPCFLPIGNNFPLLCIVKASFELFGFSSTTFYCVTDTVINFSFFWKLDVLLEKWLGVPPSLFNEKNDNMFHANSKAPTNFQKCSRLRTAKLHHCWHFWNTSVLRCPLVRQSMNNAGLFSSVKFRRSLEG